MLSCRDLSLTRSSLSPVQPRATRTKVSDMHLRARPSCRTLSRPPLQWMLFAILLHIAGPALLAELRICDARAGRPAGLAFATGTLECCSPSAAVYEDRRAAGGQDEPGCCCTCALCGPEAASHGCLGCWSSPRPTLRCQAPEEGAGSELRSHNATHWAGLLVVMATTQQAR